MSRAVLAGVFGVLLLADGALWSHGFATGRIETARLQFFPERMQGEVVTLSLVKVVEVADGRFTVRQGRFDYEVLGDPAALRPRDEVYVRGAFSGTNTVHQHWHELAPERKGKKLLGFMGLGIALVVTVLGARPTRGGLVLRG
ncbi:MAG: hypothetical protein H6736_14385 [Alphaproteobacteria bacterium]|nr:hypothetical protein [Alphaproteobacteria bacterium]